MYKRQDDFITGFITDEGGKRLQMEQASRQGHNPNNPWADTLRFELLTKIEGPEALHRSRYHRFHPGKYVLTVQVDSKRQTDMFTIMPYNRPDTQKQAPSS